MTKKIQCPDHGEQDAVLIDAMLFRYKCKECLAAIIKDGLKGAKS